jgi:dipeptidase D
MLQKILQNFTEISKIPRCSFKEEKILQFFENWAKSKNFEYKIDDAKNIVIYISATE